MPPTLPAATARNLRLITFDITGTLLHFRRSVAEQYSLIGAQFGIHAKPSDLASGFKEQWHRQCALHPNFGSSTGLPWKMWWSTLAKSTFLSAPSLVFDNQDEFTDIKKRNKKLAALANAIIEAYSTSECWEVSEGAHEVLENLSKDGLILGVMSNFDVRLEGLLAIMGLRDFFSFVLTSYEFGVAKPDARIFQEALKRAAELVENGRPVVPKEACHVGDTPSSDYVGAVHAGWNAAIVHSHPEEICLLCKKVDPCHVVNNLKELEFYLLSGRKKKNMNY